MSTTMRLTTRTILIHPDLGGPWVMLAHQDHPQHRRYPRPSLGIAARIPQRRPTARVQGTLRVYLTPLGVCLTTATPREPAAGITVERAVELA